MTSSAPTGSCPRCGATTLKEVRVKRDSVDRALIAEFLKATGGRDTGDGLLTQQVCQRCGCRWFPRTTQERQLRALSGQLGPDAMKAAQAGEAAKSGKGPKPAAAGGTKHKVRPLTIILAVIIVILLILVVVTA